MTQQPITVSKEATLQQCAEVMEKHHVGALLIEDERLVGIITEQDIVRKSVIKDNIPSKTLVKDIMEQYLITIPPDADIFEALEIMRDKNIRHLPVMNNGDMVGLITTKDILKIEPDLFDMLANTIQLREMGRKTHRLGE